MASFEKAIDFVLNNEGGLTEDAGGLTHWGISSSSYPYLNIAALTREEAILIYQRDYWKFAGFTSQRVATKMLDIYVNLPPAEAIRLLQQSLGFLQAGPVVVDGILGPQTTEHVNAADEGELVDELKARLAVHYFQKSDPSRQLGLIRRAVKG